MAFENISKGEFSASGNAVHNKNGTCIHISNDDNRHENAPFIAYCFNLQQRYDISKLEEAVNVLEELLMTGQLSDNYSNSVEQLLKEIKK